MWTTAVSFSLKYGIFIYDGFVPVTDAYVVHVFFKNVRNTLSVAFECNIFVKERYSFFYHWLIWFSGPLLSVNTARKIFQAALNSTSICQMPLHTNYILIS